MKTSQSFYGNTDGSTSFYNYTTSSNPLTALRHGDRRDRR